MPVGPDITTKILTSHTVNDHTMRNKNGMKKLITQLEHYKPLKQAVKHCQ